MADKANAATTDTVSIAAEEKKPIPGDHSNRIDLNDPHMSGQEASERALGYRNDEPKAE